MKKLTEAALAARKFAHAPYSQVQVGAAVQMSDGRVFTGCNVENSSYGGTVCAERVSIFKAVSEGSTKIVGLAVATDASPPWPPCGFCRQVVAEFAPPELPIHAVSLDGKIVSYRLADLLPHAFTPQAMLRARKKRRTKSAK